MTKIYLHSIRASSNRWSYTTLLDGAVLEASLRTYGQLNPVHVRRIEDPFEGEAWEVIDGHARVDAAHVLGWEAVECTDHGNLSDMAALELSVTLNLANASQNHYSLARAFNKLAGGKANPTGLIKLNGMVPWEGDKLEAYVQMADYDWQRFLGMKPPTMQQSSIDFGEDA